MLVSQANESFELVVVDLGRNVEVLGRNLEAHSSLFVSAYPVNQTQADFTTSENGHQSPTEVDTRAFD